jgi:hypothetical protein
MQLDLLSNLPKPFYNLRWRFEFKNKAGKIGGWNLKSARPEDSAWAISKEGLLRAYIEGENRHTFDQRILFVCSGQDYVSCQGNMYARVPCAINSNQNEIGIGVHIFWGISFILRNCKVTVDIEGSIITEHFTQSKSNYTFSEHAIGV